MRKKTKWSLRAEEHPRSSRPILGCTPRPQERRLAPSEPAKQVVVIGITRTGWLRIRVGERKGWIDRAFAKADTTFPPRTFAMAAHAASQACQPSLDQCPPNGCAAADSPHALFNIRKHGPGGGSIERLALDDLKSLQLKADNLVGEAAELDAADRNLIANLKIGSHATGEGHLAAITGFLVGRPHANSGESVNCSLTDEASNDFHISVARNASQTEFDSVVVEMVPQNRNAAWTLDALDAVKKAQRRVVVVGQLFYDNAHRVNDNPNNVLPGQPKRFSLWEVHPIGQFFVCTANGCDANTLTGFTKLEDVRFPLASL
jgi:hypothetical protein